MTIFITTVVPPRAGAAAWGATLIKQWLTVKSAPATIRTCDSHNPPVARYIFPFRLKLIAAAVSPTEMAGRTKLETNYGGSKCV